MVIYTGAEPVLTTKINNMKHKYDLKIYNGRVKVYIDGYVMFTFN